MTELSTRELGTSGLAVTTIGLGCNNFGRLGSATESLEGTLAVLDEAIELGITLLDTADIYGVPAGTSETLMGEALRGRRDRVIIATKFGHDSFDAGLPAELAKGSRAYIRLAIEASLRRLQTDFVDLYLQHTPDPSTPIEETLGALDELVAEGKVRHFGNSNFTAEQLSAADAASSRLASGRFVVAQDEYSLLERRVESDILPVVRELALGFLPYFPLHNGLLTGKFTREYRPADSRIMRQRPHVAENAPWNRIEAYAEYCEQHSVTMLEATFAWLLGHPEVTSVIAGATTAQQLRENAAAANAWRPSQAELDDISALFAPTAPDQGKTN
jgi:aryl-alcohol dehydrogenase-like predicted oxidoreductase